MFDGLGTTETTDQSEFDRLFAETAGMYRCTEIRRHVERHFKLEPGALLIRSRKWHISHRRQLAIALCYKHFRGRVSYESVARQFGGLHYSTAIFACQKFGLEPDPVQSERGRRARSFRADAQIRRFAVAA
jgi:chromosomal replication initiation ATPase DnaA